MAISLTTEPLPLTVDAKGLIRVGNTRVTLETVVTAFLEGATAEEIAHQYPALSLADVYAVLGYYLRHQADVEAYLQQWQQHGEVVRAENERRWDPAGVRARLVARRGRPGG